MVTNTVVELVWYEQFSINVRHAKARLLRSNSELRNIEPIKKTTLKPLRKTKRNGLCRSQIRLLVEILKLSIGFICLFVFVLSLVSSITRVYGLFIFMIAPGFLFLPYIEYLQTLLCNLLN